MFENISTWYHNLPEKKRWIDLLTAVLTVPVLVTVIVTNLGNLKKDDKQEVSAKVSQPSVERIIISTKEENISSDSEPILEPTNACDNSIPDYEVISPVENEKISSNPACITFRQLEQSNFCPVVWAYRINDSSWSTYTNEPICLYNMATGPVKLEIKTKLSSGSEKTYIRNFSYQNLKEQF